MTHIELKPASSVTRRALVNALNDAYADYYVPIYVSVAFLRDMVTRESLRLEHCVAAVAGRDVVGTGLLGVRGRRGWVGGMGVVPAYRRQGIGRQMMHKLIENAAVLDLTSLQLEVIIENTNAYALYSSLGFVTKRTLNVMVSEGTVGASVPAGLRVDIQRGPFDTISFEALPHAPLPWQRDYDAMAYYGRQLRTLRLLHHTETVGLCAYVPQGIGLNLFCAAAADDATGAALLDALYAQHPGYSITYLNVSENDPLLPTLRQAGFSVGVQQYEMTLPIE